MILDIYSPVLLFLRPRNNPTRERSREVVCPVILKQSQNATLQDEENTDDGADECFDDIIRIGK